MSVYSTRLLLCRPDFYDVIYEINPWMHLDRPPNHPRALAQWQGLHDALIAVGATIELVPQTKNQPDMVFTANAGLVLGTKAVVAKFHHKERQGEEPGFAKWFEENGFSVYYPSKGSFEGEGDALFASTDLLFSGFGFRSARAASDEIAEALNVKTVVPCELVDPYFYHLDTCFAPITPTQAIFFPGAFKRDSIKKMEHEIELIAVPKEDAARFACNAVVLDTDIILPSGCAETEKLLQARKFTTHAVPLDEYLKAGGAAKCLTLKL